MSTQRRRGRTKRPRDESSHLATPTQNFGSINQVSQYAPSYSDSIFSQAPSLQTGASTTGPAFSPFQAHSPHSALPPRGKVAIPALRAVHPPDSPQGSKKGRTTHACDYCRRAKAACTGGQPCVRCNNANVPCVYGDGKRDRERKSVPSFDQ